MIEKIIDKLLSSLLPTEEEISLICTKAIEILSEEENIIAIDGPVIIAGDIHGQYYDLLELFNIGGFPPDTKYLFMGDYVDRGLHSVESISLLLCLKIKYPDRIYLLRGNHESRQITQVYGFYDECIRKYGTASVWVKFTDAFDYFPLSALVNNNAFCCHGGLGPGFTTLDQLRSVNRKQDIPHAGLVCDLLWSDPHEENGYQSSPRGAGFMFGKDVVEDFNKRNDLKMICRAHQVVDEGYTWNHKEKCVTIFTAPNYCYHCGNMAAIMDLNEHGKYEFVQFEPSPNKMAFNTFDNIPDYFL